MAPFFPHDDRTGLLYALAGFALLSVGDAVVKTMTAEWPPTAIAALRYGLGAAGLSAILLAREGTAGFRMVRPGLQLVRGAAVAIATVSFFGSLFLMSLAEATTIIFVSPMITGLLAPLFLDERSRAATWKASGAAFAGVLLVLRPNFAEIGFPAFLPLLVACAMSVLFMANRAAAGKASALAMQAWLALVAAPILLATAVAGHYSGFAPLAVPFPSIEVIAKCAFVAVSASTAHWLIYLGTTRAGAATIAPMTYVQLVVAAALGWWWFGDRPDGPTMLGAAVIVGAGLYLWRAGQDRGSRPGAKDPLH
ncbi:DMT family transporter [Tsuneonella sp. SYSU-LHT278]|uniref:DMT family transporter n=1 Tax=Tsuneonella sediminis TaxID=3416089 RepID=UPI003F78E710